MALYNIEIFDRGFELVAHSNVGEIEYSIDYLTNNVNNLKIPSSIFKNFLPIDGRFGDYLVIRNGKKIEYLGLTTAIEITDSYITISYKSILNLFDTEIVIDTDLQGVGTLEVFVKKMITENFLTNVDELQNIPELDIKIFTATNDWGFNFKSDKAGMHTIITNLYHNVIMRAFTKYNLLIKPKIDLKNKKIILEIANQEQKETWIESDLPNVINKKIVLNKNSETINKLTIYNTSNYSENAIYYLHKDGKFGAENVDRITPVLPKTKGVDVEEGKSFAKIAKSEAVEVFKNNQNNHLIELEFLKNDKLVNFEQLELGQTVLVKNNNNIYRTMLTGYTKGKTIVLTFGNVRLDLTKILKRGYFKL